MSDDEKAKQIGEAVTEYQTAKVEAGHMQVRLEKVFQTYREIGDLMDKAKGSTSEPRVVDGKIDIGYIKNRISTADLLNESDLLGLLLERAASRKRLEEAKQAMNSLGITGLA